MYAQSVLTALIAWPALAAGVVLGAPERWAKHLALAASFIEFAVSVPLWWVFQPAGVVLGAPERWAKHLALAASFIECAVSVPRWCVIPPAGWMQLQLDVPWI